MDFESSRLVSSSLKFCWLHKIKKIRMVPLVNSITLNRTTFLLPDGSAPEGGGVNGHQAFIILPYLNKNNRNGRKMS